MVWKKLLPALGGELWQELNREYCTKETNQEALFWILLAAWKQALRSPITEKGIGLSAEARKGTEINRPEARAAKMPCSKHDLGHADLGLRSELPEDWGVHRLQKWLFGETWPPVIPEGLHRCSFACPVPSVSRCLKHSLVPTVLGEHSWLLFHELLLWAHSQEIAVLPQLLSGLWPWFWFLSI